MPRRPVAIGSIALLAACASPTLPLPPPEDVSVVRVDSTHVALSATCNGAPPGVVIVVLNNNPHIALDEAVSGAVTDTCGAWDDPQAIAAKDDMLTITYQQGSQISQPGYVVAP